MGRMDMRLARVMRANIFIRLCVRAMRVRMQSKGPCGGERWNANVSPVRMASMLVRVAFEVLYGQPIKSAHKYNYMIRRWFSM